jgi:transaldolase
MTESTVGREIEDFVRGGFTPHFGQLRERFTAEPVWQRLREAGTQLWLDTGSMADAQKLWTREFSALTTNNTLLNREVQTGRYDSLVLDVAKLLARLGAITEQERFVSVEEHTDLANDVARAVEYARRYHAICPKRFIVKIPFTPAGLLVTRRLSAEGISVNHTLGFSARQNYVIARIGKPSYVNVFLGRLNSFVASNELGDGSLVGEKATLASQAAVKKLREMNLAPTRQIGASFRKGAQVGDLAGIDVMTMPPKVAGEFLASPIGAEQIPDKTAAVYEPGVRSDVDREAVRLDTLWDIGEELVVCVDALEKENLDGFTPDDLIDFFAKHNCGDVLVRWSESEIERSTAEGKIPQLDNWRDALAAKSIGLDSLMNLGGFNSFAADQKAMDDRVRAVLGKGVS